MCFNFFVFFWISLFGFSNLAFASYSSKEKNLATNIQITILQILKDEKRYKKLEFLLKKSKKRIDANTIKIKLLNNKKNLLENELQNLHTKRLEAELNIIRLTVKKYAKSRAVHSINKKSSQSVIDNEVYKVLEKSIEFEGSRYNKITKKLEDKIVDNSHLLTKLNGIRKKQKELISYNQKLQNTQEHTIKILKKKHKKYVENLQKIFD